MGECVNGSHCEAADYGWWSQFNFGVCGQAEQDGALSAYYRALNAKSFAALFMTNVVRLHGLPATLISDREPQFNNIFWAHTCELLGMDKRMSSAFHPQTDGQTERANRMLEEMLRAYVSLEHDDWDAKLACAEFAINNSWQETIKRICHFSLTTASTP